MSFELHITCSKDIDKLSIDFSDGTTVIKETKQVKEKQNVNEQNRKNKNDAFLNTDDDFLDIQQDIVQKPSIIRNEKPIKVAEELQNLNF